MIWVVSTEFGGRRISLLDTADSLMNEPNISDVAINYSSFSRIFPPSKFHFRPAENFSLNLEINSFSKIPANRLIFLKKHFKWMESRLVGKEAKRRQTFQGKMQIEPGRSFYAIFLFTLKSVMKETKNGKMTGWNDRFGLAQQRLFGVSTWFRFGTRKEFVVPHSVLVSRVCLCVCGIMSFKTFKFDWIISPELASVEDSPQLLPKLTLMLTFSFNRIDFNCIKFNCINFNYINCNHIKFNYINCN